jgi:hypothetical protein
MAEPAPGAEDFLVAGLASWGIEADEVEMAVIGAAHDLFWPAIVELLSLDLGDVPVEPTPDLSRAPEPRP